MGVEALVRWNREDGAVMGPGRFLDTLTRLPEAGADLLCEMAVAAASPFVTGEAPLFATFNITGAVLDGRKSRSYRWLAEILERLPPDRLVLEIVETAAIVEPERAAKLIDEFRGRGIRVALDDFGTGMSNLERLRRFPVDFVKIDRAFVEGLGSGGREEAILEATVLLADRLGIDLIAEGIETEAQAAALRGLGVDLGQGYLFGRPEAAKVWAARLNRGDGRTPSA